MENLQDGRVMVVRQLHEILLLLLWPLDEVIGENVLDIYIYDLMLLIRQGEARS